MPSSCMNCSGGLAARVGHEHHGVLGQPRFREPLAQRRHDGRVESAAPTMPRSIVALPAFRHSPAASLVTLGRFS